MNMANRLLGMNEHRPLRVQGSIPSQNIEKKRKKSKLAGKCLWGTSTKTIMDQNAGIRNA